MELSIFSAILGLCAGSFLNALIFRLANCKSVCRGRSFCPRCQKTLRWFELIPVVSFILQKGLCRSCKTKISWQYPLVELFTAFFFMIGPLIFNLQSSIFNLFLYWFIVAVLIAVFVYDLRHGEIPDFISFPAITIVLLCWLANYFGFLDFEFFWVKKSALINLFLGIAIGGGFFALQFLASRGKWIGGGDIRLGVLMGIILGWPKILVALFIAYVGGAIVCLFLLIAKKKTLKSAVPLGVFLIPSFFICLFWGQTIINWF